MSKIKIRNHNKKSRIGKKHILQVAVVVILTLGTAAFLLSREKSNAPLNTSPTAAGSINYNPPTEQEIQEAEANKDKLSENQAPAPTQTTDDGRKAVLPVITSANASGVSAYIPGIFEEGGTCSATFKHGNDTANLTSKGFENSNYTSCVPLYFDSPLSTPGKWTVTIDYSSPTSAGKSTAWSFEVQ